LTDAFQPGLVGYPGQAWGADAQANDVAQVNMFGGGGH